ncbi:DUF1329 domain-containing protein [bacterium]|nr:DUF1329 domain-containing protein [bacterium]
MIVASTVPSARHACSASRALAASAAAVVRRAAGSVDAWTRARVASAFANAVAGVPRPHTQIAGALRSPVDTPATLRHRRRVAKSALLLIALALALAARGAAAQATPGDVVTPDTIAAAGELLTPGVAWCVRRGMTLRVGEPRPIPPPAAYREATERYAPQVRLGSDGLTLQNYVAGLPFPAIDPADPQAAVKVMWNAAYKWLATDDLDARDFSADAGPIGRAGAPMTVERHFQLGYLRRLFYNGRLYVDPRPSLPNPEGIRYRESLHPVAEPLDLRGVGMTGVRYISPGRPDDSWLYLPNLRRVRRLSNAQRSDALFNQDIDSDSYFGYSGHIGWMDWRFLGERTVLAPMHGTHFPVQWGAGSADFAFDDVWEPRRVYVIEGTSKLPQYAYAKRVLFVDAETYVVPLSDLYDHSGQLWKVWLNLFSYRKEPFAGAKVSVYPDDMGFSPAVVMVDVNADHVTRVALPSRASSDAEGWFFNMGDRLGLTESWFKISSLIQAAQ